MRRIDSRLEAFSIGALGFIQIISWGTCFYVFGLVLAPIEAEIGLSRSAAAMAFPLALLFEGLCSVAVGAWIARGLGGYVMTVGSLLAGAGLCILSQATSLLQFHAAWVLLGASFACTLYTPLFSWITTEYPDSYQRKVTIISLITGFSSTLFLPLGGWLIATYGWRQCLLSYAFMNFMFCAPGHWLVLKSIRFTAGVSQAVALKRKAYFSPEIMGLFSRRFKIFVCLAIFTSALGALSSTMAAHLIPMLTERGIAAETALLAPAAIGALQTLSRVPMLMGWVARKIHHMNFCLILMFPLAMFFLQKSGTSGILLIAFVVLYGTAHGGWTIVRATAVPQYLGAEGAAVINGKIAFLGTIGRILLPAVVAFLWTADHGYAYGYWILLGVACLGFGAYALAQKNYFDSGVALN